MEETGYTQSKEERARSLAALAKMKALEAKYKDRMITKQIDNKMQISSLNNESLQKLENHYKSYK